MFGKGFLFSAEELILYLIVWAVAMKKVLCISESLSDNLGDVAIARCAEQLFRERGFVVHSASFAGSEIRASSGIDVGRVYNQGRFSVGTFRKALKKIPLVLATYWVFKNSIRVFTSSKKGYSFAAIGGGQLVMSSGCFPVAFFVWSLALKMKGIPTYLVGVGVGEKFNFLDRQLIRYAIGTCVGVFVRDQRSKQQMYKLFNREAVVIPDLAFSYSLEPVVRSESSDLCVVGIVDYAVYVKYAPEMELEVLSEHDYMKRWYEEIRRLGVRNILLLSTTYADLDQARKFSLFLSQTEPQLQADLVDELVSLEEYVSYLRSAKTVFSGRMHSLILGEVCGCHVVTWEISRKLQQYNVERGAGKDVECLKKELQQFTKELTQPYQVEVEESASIENGC